uniref:Uncharacterized protein n=1 Tax=Arundo donax TaxID=35708 RepID=A0A0A9PTG9_ARUDO
MALWTDLAHVLPYFAVFSMYDLKLLAGCHSSFTSWVMTPMLDLSCMLVSLIYCATLLQSASTTMGACAC